MDEKLQALEQKIDEQQASIERLQTSIDLLIHYTVERDSRSFMQNVEANLYSDVIFELLTNPGSFFDRAGEG